MFKCLNILLVVLLLSVNGSAKPAPCRDCPEPSPTEIIYLINIVHGAGTEDDFDKQLQKMACVTDDDDDEVAEQKVKEMFKKYQRKFHMGVNSTAVAVLSRDSKFLQMLVRLKELDQYYGKLDQEVIEQKVEAFLKKEEGDFSPAMTLAAVMMTFKRHMLEELVERYGYDINLANSRGKNLYDEWVGRAKFWIDGSGRYGYAAFIKDQLEFIGELGGKPSATK